MAARDPPVGPAKMQFERHRTKGAKNRIGSSVFLPATKKAKSTYSDCRVGVARSRFKLNRPGSWHPIATMRHFGQSSPTPQTL